LILKELNPDKVGFCSFMIRLFHRNVLPLAQFAGQTTLVSLL